MTSNAAESRTTEPTEGPSEDSRTWTEKGQHRFNQENAKEYGRKGGLASAGRTQEPKDGKWLTKQAQDALADLVNAAHGRGRWKDLPLDKQFQALLKLLEFGIGKPTTQKKEEDDPKGFDLGVPGV